MCQRARNHIGHDQERWTCLKSLLYLQLTSEMQLEVHVGASASTERLTRYGKARLSRYDPSLCSVSPDYSPFLSASLSITELPTNCAVYPLLVLESEGWPAYRL